MRTAARVFGILLVIAGIIYGAMAIIFLSNVDGIATTLEIAKATEHKEFGFTSIEDWKRGAEFNAWLHFMVGLAATVCGIGIATYTKSLIPHMLMKKIPNFLKWTTVVSLVVVVLAFVYFTQAVKLPSYEINQKIIGTLTVNDRPASGVQVALIDRTKQESCDKAANPSATDKNGQFLQLRTASVGRLAVIVQQDTLCIFENSTWQPIWNGTYGPAHEEINFSCDRHEGSAWKCTMKVMS